MESKINTNIGNKSLTNKEKVLLSQAIFKNTTNTGIAKISNTGNFLIDTFQKLQGFDFRWTSLITNEPLLFEDLNYYHIKKFINNTITDNELKAFNNGNLTDLYSTFDELLVCNLKYYDRIISYCTMVFMHYVEINDIKYDKGLNKIPFELELTPTKIWCAVLTNEQSTKWEIEYGWNIRNLSLPIKNSTKSIFEINYNRIYRENKTFAKFCEYNSVRVGVNGYRQVLLMDNTPNRKLAQVCQKFTKTSTAISESQLDTIYKYSKTLNNINEKLYSALDSCLNLMFKGDKSQYSIYIFNNEFFIFTSKFSLKVSKYGGKIQKDYLANSYECFLAEEYLIESIKTQIEWSQFKLDAGYDYDKNILKSLLTNLLNIDYKKIVCINKSFFIDDEWKESDKKDIKLVKVTFSGIFSNIRITENFMINNRVIKKQDKVLSKANAADYLIDRGYYIFGYEEDVNKLIENDIITKKDLINYYSKYCIPVSQYMSDIVTMYQLNKMDILQYYLTDNLNPEKLNNHNIVYTSISNKDEFAVKNVFSNQLKRITDSLETHKKSYWKVIE